MPLSKRPTLTRYLIEQRRRFPDASGDFNALILDLSIALKAIGRRVAFGALDAPFDGGHSISRDDARHSLDQTSNEMLLRQTEWSGHLAAVASQELEEPYQIPSAFQRGKYLLVTNPLDGSRSIDVNLSMGTIFAVLRAPDDAIDTGDEVPESVFLQTGTGQVAAGYALYGPATMLVLTVGNGVVGCTLDPNIGEFKVTHPDMRIPPETREFAINTSNSRFWEPPVKRYVDECLLGQSGPRGKDFNMRWIASLVAEAHRILMRGGVFLYPRDTRDQGDPGRLRLLYEANPIGMLIEQAGGRASTGRRPILDVMPSRLHQRVGFVFGSRNEVERIERYHLEPSDNSSREPLFAERSLFRA